MSNEFEIWARAAWNAALSEEQRRLRSVLIGACRYAMRVRDHASLDPFAQENIRAAVRILEAEIEGQNEGQENRKPMKQNDLQK